MGTPSKGRFILVAAGSALLLALVAKLVADFFVDEPLAWLPSTVTAVVVGAFLALIVFRPRGDEREADFTVTNAATMDRREEE